MKKLQQTLVVGALLVTPFVLCTTASAAMCQAGYTGPDSTNTVREHTSSRVRVENSSNLSATNTNTQDALSGEARVRHNTTGGLVYIASVGSIWPLYLV